MYYFPDRRVISMLGRRRGSLVQTGPAVRVYVIQQPSTTATSGVAIVQQPVVVVLDAFGNLLQIAGIQITATVDIGTLSGTVTVGTNALGIATFTNLAFAVLGGSPVSSRTLTFTATGLVAGAANAVLVSDTGASDIDGLVGIGNCEILIDAIAGVTGDGTNITAITDLSGKNRTITRPDGVIPFTATKWNGNQPAWQFVAATKHRMQVVAASGAPPYATLPQPMTVVTLLDQFLNTTNQPNLYRDATPIHTVGFMDFGGAWGIFDGTILDSPIFSAVSQPGKVIRIDVHNGAASLIRATDDVSSGDAGNTAGSLAAYFIGSDGFTNNFAASLIQAVHILYSKALSTAEQNTVVAILKKRYGGIVPPSSGHGPILSASSVIDGVTVTVEMASAFAGPDFSSTDLYSHTLVFRFSSPLRQFAITQKTNEYDGSIGVTNAPTLVACDGYSPSTGIVNPHATYGYTYFGNVLNERGAVRYDAGFSVAVLRNAGINFATYGWLRSLWTDARFWRVGEPL